MTEHFKLKPISREAIPRAIQKAERYRLINQSWAAESICRDVLEIDPANQQVLVMFVLTLTDQLAEMIRAAGFSRVPLSITSKCRCVPVE